jgi:hypothetical protein
MYMDKCLHKRYKQLQYSNNIQFNRQNLIWNNLSHLPLRKRFSRTYSGKATKIISLKTQRTMSIGKNLTRIRPPLHRNTLIYCLAVTKNPKKNKVSLKRLVLFLTRKIVIPDSRLLRLKGLVSLMMTII